MSTQHRYVIHKNPNESDRHSNSPSSTDSLDSKIKRNPNKLENQRLSTDVDPIKPAIAIITNVYYPIIGGISTYVKNLEMGFSQRGYKVSIIAFPDSVIRKEDRIKNRMFYRIVHELAVLAFIGLSLCKILLMKLRWRNVVVHSQSASFCMAVGVFARFLGVKSIHTFHSPIKECSIRLRTMLPFIHDLVCVSEEHKTQYVAKCGIPNDTIVIPGGVDCNFFRPPTPDEMEKAKIEIARRIEMQDSPGPIVTVVGRVIKEKGIDVFLEAAMMVSKNNQDAIFIAVGPTDQSISQIDYVKNLQKRIDKSLNFHVFKKEDMEGLRAIYHASTISVYPSLFEEASPLVPIESMATGIPVIASRIGGLKSCIDEGVNGYFVEPGDSEGLAQRIVEMLRDPVGTSKMGKEARGFAVSKYSVDVMLDAYERLYALHVS